MKRILQIAFVVALLVIGFYLFEGFHLFNRNRFEIARRASCINNLRRIGEVLRERGLELTDTNTAGIAAVLTELGLRCPAGLIANHDEREAGYFPEELPTGQIVITESSKNHNPGNLRLTSLSATRFYLQHDWSATSEVGER